MRRGFYGRLALDGIRKNSRLYVPCLITSVMMVAVHYIMLYISKSGVVGSMAGGSSMSQILDLGGYVVTIFAVVFLFYTNSFLVRRRKKEFGLYNVLGMNKGNINRVLLWETFYSWFIALAGGLVIGIVLSKIAEAGLKNLVKRDVDFVFTLSQEALMRTVLLFSAIYLLILLSSIWQVRGASPMELIRSDRAGEKPPKANWIIGIAGALLLLAGYGLCLAIRQPMAAILYFFVAVILIVAGIYLVFIAGSVILCRILQKNRNYYYRTNHFVSVSSMMYRMKRNGAGLASICILLTMVLVMISSSSCLYFNAEDCMAVHYPCQIDACVVKYGYDENSGAKAEKYNNIIRETAAEMGADITKDYCHQKYSMTGRLEDSKIDIVLNSETDQSFIDYDKVAEASFIDVKDYNRMYGKSEKLNEGEALCCAIRTKDVSDVFTVGDTSFKIVGQLDPNIMDADGASRGSVCPSIFLVVSDLDKTAKTFTRYKDYDGSPMLTWYWSGRIDTDLDETGQKTLSAELDKKIIEASKKDNPAKAFAVSRAGKSFDFYETFGALFFIGFLLSIVFLVACVVIIYYKQISEGFEDQSRFDIMQKVGMTKDNIRDSINSQMRTVFLLPIGFAVLNMVIIFPIVYKILMLFGLFNLMHLVVTAVISVLICTIFYVIVYRATSNTYCRIVS